MLSIEERRFFAGIARGAAELSRCSDHQGAVIVQSRRICGYGFNRKLTPNLNFEISAIQDVLYTIRGVDISDSVLFCVGFPSFDDLKAIIATGITKIYFYGEITDSNSVLLINNLKIPLEIIKLE